MTDWEKIRDDFPITKNFVYFQSAAMSPPPKPVFKSIQKEYKKLHMQGDIHWTTEPGFTVLPVTESPLLRWHGLVVGQRKSQQNVSQQICVAIPFEDKPRVPVSLGSG